MTASEPRPTGDDVLKLVEEATAVEREAGAKVADAEAMKFYRYIAAGASHQMISNWRYGLEIAERIAAQIRARGQK